MIIMKQKIPKKIHYCWFGGNPLPDDAKKYIATWKKYCPDYELIEWNESNFDLNSNTYIKEAYEAKKWAFITDYVGLYVMYNFGGVYMDTDVELLSNLDKFWSMMRFLGLNLQIGFLQVLWHVEKVFHYLKSYWIIMIIGTLLMKMVHMI